MSGSTVDESILRQKSKITQWWFFGLSIVIALSGAVAVMLTQISNPAGGKVTWQFTAAITSNLPNLGLQGASYPLDIAFSTFAMLLGVGLFGFSFVSNEILVSNYVYNDQWLRLCFQTFTHVGIIFFLAQSGVITDWEQLLELIFLVVCLNGFNYVSDQANDHTPQLMALPNEAVVAGGTPDAEHDAALVETVQNMPGRVDLTYVRYHAHIFAWMALVGIWIPVLAQLISTTIVQANVEATTPCPGREWFTIVLTIAGLMFDIAILILYGARYWWNSAWLRGIGNFDPLIMGLRTIELVGFLGCMVGVGAQIHGMSCVA